MINLALHLAFALLSRISRFNRSPGEVIVGYELKRHWQVLGFLQPFEASPSSCALRIDHEITKRRKARHELKSNCQIGQALPPHLRSGRSIVAPSFRIQCG